MVLVCTSIFLNACQTEQEVKQAQYMINGRGLYRQHCMNCHGDQGQGIGRLYPPLTDKADLKENRDRLAGIIRYGLEGEIIVSDLQYDGIMLPNYELTAADIAYILNYMGNSFGNEFEHVSIESVNEDLDQFLD